MSVWEKFENEITLADLVAKGSLRKSVLWWLAAVQDCELFLKVWEKFQHEILLADLTEIATESTDKRDLRALVVSFECQQRQANYSS